MCRILSSSSPTKRGVSTKIHSSALEISGYLFTERWSKLGVRSVPCNCKQFLKKSPSYGAALRWMDCPSIDVSIGNSAWQSLSRVSLHKLLSFISPSFQGLTGDAGHLFWNLPCANQTHALSLSCLCLPNSFQFSFCLNNSNLVKIYLAA